MELLLWTIVTGIVFLFIREKFFGHSPSETASAAIVMAYGIFINGALYQLNFPTFINQMLSILLILFWLIIGYSYVSTAAHKETRVNHFRDSMQIFAVGTWIAGTSVTGAVVANRLPELSVLAYILGYIALILWFFYVMMIMRRFIYIEKFEKFGHVHGAILLSTVSTESIVVVFSTLYGEQIPDWVYLSIISLGIFFYFTGLIFIARRYINSKSWDIKVDWPNTNCIIHGAMSITGLAGALSGALSSNVILIIWLWVLMWYVIVEFIEVCRAYTRVRNLGFEKGIWTYNVTQWSRNFTFGMLYAFTSAFDVTKATWINGAAFVSIREFILTYGAWVVLFFITYESLLFIKGKSILNQRQSVVKEA